uniref:Hypothetical LOC284751 n=1 Tax=Homo sapiens TaxID=9606 RepID=Q4G0G3_HUMAN|nr:Hypothetical LOC284751 [Homo sapiens]AAH93939.1 Hypothetical LOC284751 [Homo sapiens]
MTQHFWAQGRAQRGAWGPQPSPQAPPAALLGCNKHTINCAYSSVHVDEFGHMHTLPKPPAQSRQQTYPSPPRVSLCLFVIHPSRPPHPHSHRLPTVADLLSAAVD